MPSRSDGAPNLHALLIASDCYLPGHLPSGAYYPCLMGCVRDVTHVEGFLKGTLKVPDERITRLTSTNTGNPLPPEPPEKLPTYENMVAAFKAVTDRAQPGDLVYIHYSGHGGRTKPTLYPERKGAEALDESIVPVDIHNPKARYLRDLEIDALLKAMTAKGLVVTAVLDCCHSGGAVRGIDVAPRGVSFIDDTPRPAESLVPVRDGRTTRSLAHRPGGPVEPEGYTLLAACRPSESAYEFAFDGKERNGALTYWLLDSLQHIGPGVTYKMLYEKILARVHGQFAAQSPMLLGEVNRVVFGVDRPPSPVAAIVLRVDLAGKGVQLGTGLAEGIRKGARFAVGPQEGGRKAVVEVATAGATESWATVVPPDDGASIAIGDRAVLLGAGSLKLVRGVRAIRPDGQPATSADTALNAIAEALKLNGNGWVEPAAPDVPADFLVTLTREGDAYELCDGAGVPIAGLGDDLKVKDRDAPAGVVRRLVHLAQYRSRLELNNFDPASKLKDKLAVELAGVQDDFNAVDRPDPKPITLKGNVPEVRVGQTAFLRIKNNSTEVLNIAVLDLGSDWSVMQAYPPGEESFAPLDPGAELPLIPLPVGLPDGASEGSDTLKILASVGTPNFQVLLLPSLDAPASDRGERHVTRGTQSPLDQLLDAASADRPKTRLLTPPPASGEDWTVRQVEVKIRR